jgi:hypothetical protein
VTEYAALLDSGLLNATVPLADHRHRRKRVKLKLKRGRRHESSVFDAVGKTASGFLSASSSFLLLILAISELSFPSPLCARFFALGSEGSLESPFCASAILPK